MKIDIFKEDEACLAVIASMSQNKLIILHKYECWKRKGHYCDAIPANMNKVNTTVLIDSNKDITTLHTYIGTVLLGDLTMQSCYVDWEAIHTILAGQKETRL